MTKKSIDAILAELLAGPTPRLKRFAPLMDPDQSEIREFLMMPALHDWCYQSDSKKTLNYKANVRAFLKRYVIGLPIDNRDYMKSWRDNIFELRVQLEPKRENTRIFGAFAKPDVFIALHPPKMRSEFSGKDDPRWDRAIERAMDQWSVLFPCHSRIPSKPFSNCITSKCVDLCI